jgi:antirestriction protein ArdC
MHELVHSTKAVEGTRKLLETDGPQGNNFGSQNYAREELVAEVGSLLLCNHYGLNSYADPENEKLSELTQNSAAYLKNWFEGGKLEDADIVNAVSEAKRASTLITGDNLKIAAKISQAEKPEISEKTTIKI